MAQRRLLSLWLPEPPNSLTDNAAPPELPSLALWCQCVSPLTAIDAPDGIMIDISGCAHLFGGEAGLAARLQRHLPTAKIAIAATATAAWGLARYGKAGSEDILPLPLAALRLPEQTIIRLRRVGIRNIGQLQRLPRAELTAGYGPEPTRKLAQALGQAAEVLQFISPPPEWRETEHYAEPIFAPVQLQAALTRLTQQLCTQLSAAQRGVTSLIARFYRIDSQRPEISLSFASPSRDEFQITKLLIEKLAQDIDPAFGIETITLDAATTEKLAPSQSSIARAAPDYTRPINTILNRLGVENIWRVAPHASHIPEYTVRCRPVNMPPVPWTNPHHPRPLRLLPEPDAITAIAPVPDDPPITFTWRGKVHRIREATGPERIAREWWRHPHDNTRPEVEFIRDYYAVEDSDGTRFWLFRTGMHGGTTPVRWYLHGFFG